MLRTRTKGALALALTAGLLTSIGGVSRASANYNPNTIGVNCPASEGAFGSFDASTTGTATFGYYGVGQFGSGWVYHSKAQQDQHAGPYPDGLYVPDSEPGTSGSFIQQVSLTFTRSDGRAGGYGFGAGCGVLP